MKTRLWGIEMQWVQWGMLFNKMPKVQLTKLSTKKLHKNCWVVKITCFYKYCKFPLTVLFSSALKIVHPKRTILSLISLMSSCGWSCDRYSHHKCAPFCSLFWPESLTGKDPLTGRLCTVTTCFPRIYKSLQKFTKVHSASRLIGQLEIVWEGRGSVCVHFKLFKGLSEAGFTNQWLTAHRRHS